MKVDRRLRVSWEVSNAELLAALGIPRGEGQDVEVALSGSGIRVTVGTGNCSDVALVPGAMPSVEAFEGLTASDSADQDVRLGLEPGGSCRAARPDPAARDSRRWTDGGT